VAAFYSITFWGLYLTETTCDLLLYEIIFKFFSYVLLILAAGYVIQVGMRRAYMHGDEVLAVIEQQQVEGLIIWEHDDHGKIIYCNLSAKRLLGLPETDFQEKLGEKEFY